MRAGQLALDLPTVPLEADALDAARAMAVAGHPGLIVTDISGQPIAVLPGSQVLFALVPSYMQDEPQLARALDESGAEDMIQRLTRKGVRELLAALPEPRPMPMVDADATVLEVAAVMARNHTPLVVVMDGTAYLGAITVSRLLAAILDTNEAGA